MTFISWISCTLLNVNDFVLWALSDTHHTREHTTLPSVANGLHEHCPDNPHIFQHHTDCDLLKRNTCRCTYFNSEEGDMWASFHQSRSTWKCCQTIYRLVLSSFRHWTTTGACALKRTGPHLVKSISGKETTNTVVKLCLCVWHQFGNMCFFRRIMCECVCLCLSGGVIMHVAHASSPPALLSQPPLFIYLPWSHPIEWQISLWKGQLAKAALCDRAMH